MSGKAKAMYEAFKQLTPTQRKDFQTLWRDDIWREWDEATAPLRKVAKEHGWTEHDLVDMCMEVRYGTKGRKK